MYNNKPVRLIRENGMYFHGQSLENEIITSEITESPQMERITEFSIFFICRKRF
jgi:hypothetical protein